MPSTSASRTNQVLQVLGQDGKKSIQIFDLPPYDSMMTHAADAMSGRELSCYASACGRGGSMITSAPTASRRRGSPA
jgi:hypothetical protein